MLNGYTVPFSWICNATGRGTVFLFRCKTLSYGTAAITLFKKFIGYGHYKLIIADKEGTRMEAVTGDMDLISRLSSELEEEREKATEEAINYVLQES